VVVVGGGNSASQAAVFIATEVSKVYLVIRGDNLYKNMSSYLADQVEQTTNIEILLNSEVRRMDGAGQLDEIELFNNKTGEAPCISGRKMTPDGDHRKPLLCQA
jgi:thioredoxin reductase (NADPH)